MKTTLLPAVATAGMVLLLGVPASDAQPPSPEEMAILAKLGPDSFASAPPLDSLVRGSVAAVVGRVVAAENLTMREGSAHANYRVAIDDVLFARSTAELPALVAGTEVPLHQVVRYDSAKRFLDRRLPVTPADACLLFLWEGPGGVSLLGGTVHFRRSTGSARSRTQQASRAIGDRRHTNGRTGTPRPTGCSAPAIVPARTDRTTRDWRGPRRASSSVR